jgi:hypothetical protein
MQRNPAFTEATSARSDALVHAGRQMVNKRAGGIALPKRDASASDENRLSMVVR